MIVTSADRFRTNFGYTCAVPCIGYLRSIAIQGSAGLVVERWLEQSWAQCISYGPSKLQLSPNNSVFTMIEINDFIRLFFLFLLYFGRNTEAETQRNKNKQ